MLILPAIDLTGGRVVRTVGGDRGRLLEYPIDPLTIARRYAEAGAPWLHLVDLDGARAGAFLNLPLIERIARAVPIPVQVGGGARSLPQVRAALDAGAARVVVGTAAVDRPEEVAGWGAEFGQRLVVALDARAERLLADGWEREVDADRSLMAVARRLAEGGVARFIHTDVQRDGTLAGPDLAGLQALLALGRPVLVAGGVGGEADLHALREAGAEGVIVGRAFLEGRLDVRRAIALSARS